MSITLTAKQRASCVFIYDNFKKADLLWCYEAAVVNAYAESRLNPYAVGDGGHSIGLFQLHDKGLGKGMTPDDRRDPDKSCQRIIQAIMSQQGARLRLLNDSGAARVEDLVAEFAHSIERCAACGHNAGDSELKKRRELTYQLFPLPHITLTEDV